MKSESKNYIMNNMNKIKEIIKEENKEAKIIDNFDEALIGTGKGYNKKTVAVYDATKFLEILIEKKKINELEAYEYYINCLENGWPDENDPIFINDFRNVKEVDLKIRDFNKKITDFKLN